MQMKVRQMKVMQMKVMQMILVLKEQLDYLEAGIVEKEGWSCAVGVFGGQFATTIGTSRLPGSPVQNWISILEET